MDLAGLFGRNDFGFPRGDVQEDHRLHLLAGRLQFDGVVVGSRACIHLAGEHFVLRRLAGGLIDQCDIEALLGKVAEPLGEHVRQIDLLAEPTHHDLELYFSVAGAGSAAGAATAARTKNEHEDDADYQPKLSLP